MKEKMIDVFEKARKKDEISVEVDLPLSPGKTVKALLIPDIVKMRQESEEVFFMEFNRLSEKYSEEELMGPVNELLWKVSLAKIKKESAKKSMENKKPDSFGEQLATQMATNESVYNILPRFLYHTDTKEPMFPASSDQKRFKNLVMNDAELLNALVSAFIEVTDKISAVKVEVKNSSTPV